ncbi:hypothetical protein B0A48_05137 [Cryoendolithus antarcticus]|uniref:J domain-containing protein n=1 Tax=Cryoendolithus antarcticus TaxID=1507870 RepID=A0A1V8TEN5_9PEZI|nr:hypothetical protein B0A48_05137 [Cryoendolithus antarcticus]
MSNSYNYDDQAQFYPFFILTLTSIITLPLTYTILRKPSDAAAASKVPRIESSFVPQDADIIDAQRAKHKRKELRLKRMLIAATGWAVMLYMVYLMVVTARHAPKIWNPYDILDIGMSASEKQINSRYRKLSVTMHPDKRSPDPAKNETLEEINDHWVEIVKAYKSLTDEEVRKNYIEFGNPDGKQSTSFGIALPEWLVANASGPYVLLFYFLLLGPGLILLVGKWWYGMQKFTREKILVTSAGNMFREHKERMDGGDVVNAISSAAEYQEILAGGKADAGLGKLEGKVLGEEDVGMLAKDKKMLEEHDDAVRRKTLALVWAYLSRVDLGDKTLEAEKYEIAPTALRMTEAFTSISIAHMTTPTVLASFHLAQSLTQAIPTAPRRMPLLQLPHFTAANTKTVEETTSTQSKEHLTIQAFMSLPPEQRRALATAAGLTSTHLSTAERLARQLPLLRIEKTFFKVQGERYIIPSSLVQFVVKARVIPPGTPKADIPALKDSDLTDPDPAEGDLKAQKEEIEQHALPLVHAPYLPRDKSPKWHVFLADTRQNRVAVPPFTFSTFDKKAFEDDGKGGVKPTFEVVTLKMQFQAPPQQGEYKFQMHLICDSYVGFDEQREVVLNVEDASRAEEVDDDDYISEPDEDTIAGQMAALKGQPTSDGATQPPPRRPRRQVKPADDEESDYESGTDEDVDSDSETDTDTDSDGE